MLGFRMVCQAHFGDENRAVAGLAVGLTRVPTITVYRSRTAVFAASKATVRLDGEPVGTVRGRQRLTVPAMAGQHRVAVRIGKFTSRPLALEIGDEDVILAIRVVMPAGRRTLQPGDDHLQLAAVGDFDDRSSLMFRELWRTRPPIGYRHLRRWERLVFWAALLVGIAAWMLRRSLGRGLSLAISGPADIITLVLIVRLFIYRAKK